MIFLIKKTKNKTKTNQKTKNTQTNECKSNVKMNANGIEKL
jgi:hypothetical protein